MATIALIAVALLALLVFVLFGALLELYRDVRQLRDVAGILDRPLHVEIGSVAGSRPSSYGLPEILDSTVSGLVLFLSERCASCRALAAGLDDPLPQGLWIIIQASSATSAASFLESYALNDKTGNHRVIVDIGGELAHRLGLEVAPVGFRVENGVLLSATTVPSSRYLTSILPVPVRLKQAS